MRTADRLDHARVAPQRGRFDVHGGVQAHMGEGEAPALRPSRVDDYRLRPQRSRILRACVEVVAERGFSGSSVGLVIERANVSRATFRQLFDGLEDCFAAVLDQALLYVLGVVASAFEAGTGWQDGMRTALLGILDFLDGEPALARVTMLEALAAGPVVLGHRERVAGVLRTSVVDRIVAEVPHEWPLAAEAMFASVLGVVHAHLAAQERQPLVGLLAPLMATLTAPFSDEDEIARELSRSERAVRELLAARASGADAPRPHPAWAGADIPAPLANPRSRRAGECLSFLADHEGASNREVAAALGIAHSSQISTLLTRLADAGLLARRSDGPGRPNRWTLTEQGRLLRSELAEGGYSQ